MDPQIVGGAFIAVFQTLGVVAFVYILFRGIKTVANEVRPSLKLSAKEVEESVRLSESRG